MKAWYKDPLTLTLTALLVCVGVSMLLAFVSPSTWLEMKPRGSQDYAAWVQAIGSVAAIAAAIWIMQRQHVEQQRTLREEREAAELIACNRALFICRGYLTSAAVVRERINVQRTALNWPECVDLPTLNGGVPMDLDGLAFLALRGAQVVLTEFAHARLLGSRLCGQVNILNDLQEGKIAPRIEAAEDKKGGDLTVPEWRAAMGPSNTRSLIRSVKNVEEALVAVEDYLPKLIVAFRRYLPLLYPQIVFPSDEQPLVSLTNAPEIVMQEYPWTRDHK